MVVITGHKESWFDRLARTVPLGVTGQVKKEASFYVREDEAEVQIDLAGLIREEVLRLEHASVAELVRFAAACRRSGLGSGEIESMALVLSRGYGFCTADSRAMRTLRDLGLEPRWCALEELFNRAGLDSGQLGPEYRRSAWR